MSLSFIKEVKKPAATTLTVVLWSFTTQLLTGLVVLVAWQAASAVTINGIVVRQSITPDRLQSRVNTTARMIAWGGQPAGAAIGGLLADTLDVQTALLLAALGAAVSLVLGLLSRPLRKAPTLEVLTQQAADTDAKDNMGKQLHGGDQHPERPLRQPDGNLQPKRRTT